MQVLDEMGDKCRVPRGVCRLPCGGKLHIDHIVPVALGGSHNKRNLRPLCSVHHSLRWGPWHDKVRQKLIADGMLPVGKWRDHLWRDDKETIQMAAGKRVKSEQIERWFVLLDALA